MPACTPKPSRLLGDIQFLCAAFLEWFIWSFLKCLLVFFGGCTPFGTTFWSQKLPAEAQGGVETISCRFLRDCWCPFGASQVHFGGHLGHQNLHMGRRYVFFETFWEPLNKHRTISQHLSKIFPFLEVEDMPKV